MSAIAAVILAFNEERRIEDCIASVRWADEVVVVDTFSDDNTVALSQAAGATVLQQQFENFSQIRNAALERVRWSWIFFLDADERATPELADEIRQVTVNRPENGWWVPRHNYIFGRLTLWAGWYPDYQMRLLRRGHARYERAVHEVVALDGDAGYLQHPLDHYNYETVSQFHEKQRRYTDFEVQILHREGVRPRWHTPYSQTARHFWWRLVTLKGYRDGLHGLRLSMLTAWYQGIKFLALRRLS